MWGVSGPSTPAPSSPPPVGQRSPADAATGRPQRRVPVAALLPLVWLGLLLAGWALGSVVADSPPSFDGALVRDLHGASHGALTSVMRALTWLGSPLVLNIVFAVAFLGLAFARSWRNLLFLVLASPGTVLLVQIIKASVDRTRPSAVHLTSGTGPSWPSGHASSSAALYGALLLIALGTPALAGRWARRVAVSAVAVVLVGIGASRVYLGVHYPTDVLAAWVIVAVWLTVLMRTVGPHRHGSDRPAAVP